MLTIIEVSKLALNWVLSRLEPGQHRVYWEEDLQIRAYVAGFLAAQEKYGKTEGNSQSV